MILDATVLIKLDGGYLMHIYCIISVQRSSEYATAIFCIQFSILRHKGAVVWHNHHSTYRSYNIADRYKWWWHQSMDRSGFFWILEILVQNRTSVTLQNDVQDCLRSLIDTPVYIAPEINRILYCATFQVSATGIILYPIIPWQYPLHGLGEDEWKLQHDVNVGFFFLVDPMWRSTTRLCLSFVRELLHPDPMKWIKTAAALLHQWLPEINDRN